MQTGVAMVAKSLLCSWTVVASICNKMNIRTVVCALRWEFGVRLEEMVEQKGSYFEWQPLACHQTSGKVVSKTLSLECATLQLFGGSARHLLRRTFLTPPTWFQST